MGDGAWILELFTEHEVFFGLGLGLAELLATDSQARGDRQHDGQTPGVTALTLSVNRLIEMLKRALLIAGHQCEIAKHDQRCTMQRAIADRRIRGAGRLGVGRRSLEVAGLEREQGLTE